MNINGSLLRLLFSWSFLTYNANFDFALLEISNLLNVPYEELWSWDPRTYLRGYSEPGTNQEASQISIKWIK